MTGPLIVVTKEWNVWNIINVNGPMTCQEFVDHYKKEYNIKILVIAFNFKSFIEIHIRCKTKKLSLKSYENTNCSQKR